MSRIDVKVFGIPIIEKSKEKIFLPFRKAEALFYYLIVHQQATRDELVNLLWSEVEEETAKKNLRNAMYKIRKAFNLDIIISPQKSVVMLNPDIEIHSDLKIFLQEDSSSIKAYGGEFLRGFFLKEDENFQDWLFQKREFYRDLYISKLYKNINKAIKDNKEDEIEDYAKLLIQEDNFDEEAYRILMRLYSNQGNYNKAIETYEKLKDVLSKELGITPDTKTVEVFKEILENRHKEFVEDTKDLEKFFYGRKKEIQVLEKHLRGFLKGDNFQSVIITGEAGIGKTKLKNKILEKLPVQEDILLLQTHCYQAEEEFILKPWNPIMSKLAQKIKEEKIDIPPLEKNLLISMFPVFADGDRSKDITLLEELNQYNYRLLEEAVIDLFNRFERNKKIIIIFEDIQWVDTMSLFLLSSLLLKKGRNNLIFIGTCREDYKNKIDIFISKMKKHHILEEIYLPRLTPSETRDFIKKALPNLKIKEEIFFEIYRETQGNTFFVMEYLKAIKEKRNFKEITPNMEEILKSRFLDISKEGKKLLNIISLFFDKAPLDILKTLLDKDELEIIHIIEELQNRKIIMEIEETDKISFQFTHSKFREYIYNQQSSAMRKVLHNKVANILEKQLKNENIDKLIYSKIIYHFSCSGDKIKALKYSIKNINAYMDFTHELFPILNPIITTPEGEVFEDGGKNLTKYLEDIEKSMNRLEEEFIEQQDKIKIQIEFYYLMGRYFIAEGGYEKGIDYINKMLNLAQAIGEYRYLLKGYKQMIYYCIQIYDTQKMDYYLQKGLELSKKYNLKKEEAILLRLKGRNKIMVGQDQEAEELLKQSISIFEEISKTDDRYLLNIAAAYNYIGEIRRYNMKFSNALNYYDKAIAICQQKRILQGLSIFNTNAGQAAFDMGDYTRAKDYFQKAIYYYNQMPNLWGRSIAEAYMALLLVREGCYREAIKPLQEAQTYAQKLQSPYEMGIIYRVMAEIKSMMSTNETLNKLFYPYLKLDLQDYCIKGIKFLQKLRDTYEKEILKVFIKEYDK